MRVLFIIKKLLKVNINIWFWRDFLKYKKLDNRFNLLLLDLFPILNENTPNTNFDSHYIYHVAWAIRKVLSIKEKENISKHVDFSSSLHFSSNLSASIPVEFYDYRPADLSLSNLKSDRADLTNLSNFKDNSIKSLSCMHVVEHIGLGRYGDMIDPLGDIKAVDELKRICEVGGNILFVVPVGKERIQFNAHRVYSFDTINNMFGNNFELKEFSIVKDNHTFLENLSISEAREVVANQNYGCGCFWFVKKL